MCPSSSRPLAYLLRPPRSVIERFWNSLRRRVTHNRFFDTLADLKHSIGGGALDLSVLLNPQKLLLLSDRLLDDGPEPLGCMTRGSAGAVLVEGSRTQRSP